MKMSTVSIASFITCAALAAPVWAATPAPTTPTVYDPCKSYRFKVKDLGAAPFGYTGIRADFINDNGSIAGRVYGTGGSTPYHYNGIANSFSVLTNLPGAYVVGLNNHEQITGNLTGPPLTGPVFLYNTANGNLVTYPTNGQNNVASQLNNQGAIVGAEYQAAPPHTTSAMRWENGVTTALIPPTAGGSWAHDIDDKGKAVGSAYFPAYFGNSGIVWENGIVTPLPGFPPMNTTGTRRINDNGSIIVGFANIPVPPNYSVPVYWKKTAGGFYSITSIKRLPNASPIAVNNYGHILLWELYSTAHPLYNSRTNTYHTISHRTITPGWTLQDVADMNNNCQFAANAFDTTGTLHAIRLDPQ